MAFYLYVKGYGSETTLADLIVYFQSKESGGGYIDDGECKFEKNEAIIAFHEEEDLLNVLKHDHVFRHSTLTISHKPFNRPKPKPAPRRQKPQENMTPPKPANNKPIIGEIKTVIVTGISPQTTENTLQLFFENEKQSGGGDIENIQRIEPQVAHVTFTSAQVASSVLEKGNLEIDGYLLQLKAKKPEVTFPKDKKKLLIKNVNPMTTKDGLTNYVELITRLDVKDLVLGNDNNAMVTLDSEPDMMKVTEKAKTKPLDGVVLRISNPPICHSVLMTGFNMETTKNTIELKFENPKYGGGEILDIVYQQERGKAVISFFDPNVIESISQEHTLDGATITARPYYPFLDEKVTDVARNIKKVIQVSPDIMDHVSNRCDKEFLQEFGFEITTATYDKEKKELTFPTTLPTGDLIEKKIEAIESYFNQFTIKEIQIPKVLFLKSKDEVEEKLKETMEEFRNEAHATIEDDNQCIVVTGKKEKLTKVENALQKELNELEKKKKMVTKQLSLEQHKLMLIFSLGFEQRFEAESDVEVKIDHGILTLKGLKELVESAKDQALEEYIKIKEEFIDLSKPQEDYLMSGGLEKINDGLKKRKVEALICLDKSKPRKAIVELMDIEKFEEVKECLLEQVYEEGFTVEEESVDLLKSKEWKTFQDTLEKESGVKISTIGQLEMNIWLTGEKTQVKKACKKLKHFVTVNTIFSESIIVDQTIVQHLSRFCKSKMKNIEDTLKSCMVKLETGERSFIVQGTKEGVRKAKNRLQDIIDDLAHRKIPVEKPGMQKYLVSETGKTSLGGIESRYQCTINLTGDKKERSARISSGVNPRASNPSTMLLCSYETPEKVLLKVYQDDITTHACDVIVNAANGDLEHIGGLAKMIVDKGGKEIQEDCDQHKRKKGTLYPGECYKGIPGKLPCKHVIHAVGPQWDNSNRVGDRQCLEFACENMLEAAKDHSSIALPAVGSGIYQVPKDVCADVMVEAAVNFSLNNGRKAILKEIHFVNNDSTTVQTFLKEFKKRFGDEPTFKKHFPRPVKHVPSRYNQDEGFDQRPGFDTERQVADFAESANEISSEATPRADRITTNTKGTISIIVGDLSTHQADVLVNTTSENLKLDSNPCSRALSNKAGPILQQKCSQLGKLNMGQVEFTEGGNLLCKEVCHVNCTQWDNGQGEKVLRSIIQNCLTKSHSRGMKSIAFPAIGTGTLGFPHQITAKICFEECKEFDKKNPSTCLKDIHFVVYHQDQASIKAFKDELRKQPEWEQTGSKVGRKKEGVSRKERRKPKAESLLKEKEVEMTREEKISEAQSPEEDDGAICVFVQDEVNIRVLKGDITKENTDVIAHLSNPGMSMAGGVARALIKNGGEEIEKESRVKKPVKKYSTVLTTAGRLQAKYIAHMAGPDSPNSDDIKKCITNCLKDITNHNCRTISIPAIATGQLNMPAEKSAKAMLTAIMEFLQISPGSLRTVRIVIYDEEIFKKFSKAAKKLLHPKDKQSPGILRSLYNSFASLWRSDSGSIGAEGEDGSQKPRLFLEIFAEKDTLNKVVDHINRIMDEQMKNEVIEDDLIKKLSEAHVSQITNTGKENNVEVTIQNSVDRIIVRGHTEDVSIVTMKITSILNDVKSAEQEKEIAEIVSQGVQWYWEDTDGSKVEYDVENNSKIEKAYVKKTKSVTFLLEEGKCEIIFDNMQETNVTTKEKTKIFRKDLKVKADIPVPDYWDPQPKDTNGKNAPVHLVTLDPTNNTNHSEEYKKVSDGFSKTAANTIVKIERIQNPSLFKLYALNKQSMDERNGSNEKLLYHGTDATNIPDINQNGLNRIYNGVNATMYGKGIYFATDAKFSVGYAKPDASGTKYMYVARVAVGEFTVGDPNMKVPPKKTGNISYDSTVNRNPDPSIFVMFYDNQYYPEYLITFK